MSLVKGVILLPLDDESYRSNAAHHAFLAKANTGEKIPDPRQAATSVIEHCVRQAISLQLSLTRFRVLRWEERDARSRYFVRFKELDGVFQSNDGNIVLLEVKASATKSSLKSGLKQIRRALDIISRIHPKSVGILAVADLSKWSNDFGQPFPELADDYFEKVDLTILEWPPRLPADRNQRIFVSRVPDETTLEWMSSYEGVSDECSLPQRELG